MNPERFSDAASARASAARLVMPPSSAPKGQVQGDLPRFGNAPLAAPVSWSELAATIAHAYGAQKAFVASSDGLLVASVGGEASQFEEVAARICLAVDQAARVATPRTYQTETLVRSADGTWAFATADTELGWFVVGCFMASAQPRSWISLDLARLFAERLTAA